MFESQGYCDLQEVLKLTWEDLEDIGIKRLGHLKRLGLAIKKMKVSRLIQDIVIFLCRITATSWRTVTMQGKAMESMDPAR